MIIVRLAGGLGNQIFQYAAGRRLALARRTELKLDLSAYATWDLARHYSLACFCVAAEPARPGDLARFEPGTATSWRDQAQRLAAHFMQGLRPARIEERAFTFDPTVLHAPVNTYLEGYWQSEKYFKDAEPTLRRDLTFQRSPNPANAKLLAEIQGVPSISLHVRRGDYVNNPQYNQYHGLCGLDYYQAAVAYMATRVSDPHFFVFSDDPAWVQANLHTGYVARYVTHNGTEHDYEDLRLMSACRHHIIANSSFSWWGAWLGVHPDKIVIAPQRWFAGAGHDTRDLIPPGWLRL